jgi:hypothetical protein
MASAIQQELVVQSTNGCGLALHKSSFPQRPLPESIDLSLCYPAMQLEAVKLTEAGELQSCSACGIAPYNVGCSGNLDFRLWQGKPELYPPTLLKNLHALDCHAIVAQVKQKAGSVRCFGEVDQRLDVNA